ncbi:GMC family oxidoreductase N-terminal domain-containing protein [Aliiroseovarius sp. KMU-50]|uniref:GMC family oxidoreductase N-terminal domain-containing protein n=1 Tax=Aliiroseovarius salicola TaxID=3009082 RepID=A0ABT4W4X0_9RHOB|nr:GMC family oxidoreductase N-terminal domain-containing protein [Aliiroseovarius sp. KMU-50]MDA5095572.1 GMC family oxidoreductase N-terminal domain-containing protein [Aliiroseovarius sp. KMU-50]
MDVDYIIVGAGSAGCILADRLSANSRHKVLVLEAGGSDASFWIKLPLGYGMTFNDPRVNWRYTAASDPGLNGRKANWPRGRVLGGSGSINAMAYLRGLAHDFDDWERAGATGWGWDTVRETYGRLEHPHGPIHVADLRAEMHPFTRHFLSAATDMGWPQVEDMNAEETEGLGFYRSNLRQGRRWSSADAFLRPAKQRANVQIVTGALVERLTFEARRVTGLTYRIGDQTHHVTAKAEVTLSAGAVNSPQLLQLSGIGRAAHLQSVGIDVVQDLSEVGQGMQDHLAITHHFAASEPTLNGVLGTVFGKITAGARYLLTRRGPLSVPVNQVGGYVRSSPDLPAPDMQVYCNPASYSTTPDGRPDLKPDPGFILSVQPCRPTSRGSVTITSADPTKAPEIQPNSLVTEKDRGDAVHACEVLWALSQTPSMRRVTTSPHAPDLEGMNKDAMLENFRNRAATNFHPSCTCRMGHDASNSVLDHRLRVHGVGGLRVVDASSFPNLTSGNTNAPTMMLAMRAADLILEDARST